MTSACMSQRWSKNISHQSRSIGNPHMPCSIWTGSLLLTWEKLVELYWVEWFRCSHERWCLGARRPGLFYITPISTHIYFCSKKKKKNPRHLGDVCYKHKQHVEKSGALFLTFLSEPVKKETTHVLAFVAPEQRSIASKVKWEKKMWTKTQVGGCRNNSAKLQGRAARWHLLRQDGKFLKICSKIRLCIPENEPSGNHNMFTLCVTHTCTHACTRALLHWNWCLLTSIWDRRAAQRHLLPLSFRFGHDKEWMRAIVVLVRRRAELKCLCPRSRIRRFHSTRFSLMGRI